MRTNNNLFDFLGDEQMQIYPFKPNGISHSYLLDQFISVLRVVRLYFFIIQITLEEIYLNKQ